MRLREKLNIERETDRQADKQRHSKRRRQTDIFIWGKRKQLQWERIEK